MQPHMGLSENMALQNPRSLYIYIIIYIYLNHIIIPQVNLFDMGNFPHIFRQSQGRTPRGSEGLGCDHIDGQRLRRDCGGCRVEGRGCVMALGRGVVWALPSIWRCDICDIYIYHI